MAKEKSINPAQAQRKLEKQKALKKGALGYIAVNSCSMTYFHMNLGITLIIRDHANLSTHPR